MRSEQSIEEVRRSIATVPWERLAHAYHGAWDAPEHLAIFVSSTASDEALNKSIDWMWGSILHQGSIYSASTPVLWILIDLLAAWPEHPAAESILRGVQTVVDAIPEFRDSYDDECGSRVWQLSLPVWVRCMLCQRTLHPSCSWRMSLAIRISIPARGLGSNDAWQAWTRLFHVT